MTKTALTLLALTTFVTAGCDGDEEGARAAEAASFDGAADARSAENDRAAATAEGVTDGRVAGGVRQQGRRSPREVEGRRQVRAASVFG
jgi:hypothetical protein